MKIAQLFWWEKRTCLPASKNCGFFPFFYVKVVGSQSSDVSFQFQNRKSEVIVTLEPEPEFEISEFGIRNSYWWRTFQVLIAKKKKAKKGTNIEIKVSAAKKS